MHKPSTEELQTGAIGCLLMGALSLSVGVLLLAVAITW
jgi:hypothetical protein